MEKNQNAGHEILEAPEAGDPTWELQAYVRYNGQISDDEVLVSGSQSINVVRDDILNQMGFGEIPDEDRNNMVVTLVHNQHAYHLDSHLSPIVDSLGGESHLEEMYLYVSTSQEKKNLPVRGTTLGDLNVDEVKTFSS